MRKSCLLIVLASLVSIQTAFADDMSVSKPCKAVAKACLDAGYFKKDSGKKFWMDCMKPVLLGKTVTGVKIDADTVKSCRTDKINDLTQELKDFNGVAQ